jgi:hypothetical protein
MDTVSGNSPGNNNKLIGSVEIPLSSVPASGLNKWWNLEKQPEKVIFCLKGLAINDVIIYREGSGIIK